MLILYLCIYLMLMYMLVYMHMPMVMLMQPGTCTPLVMWPVLSTHLTQPEHFPQDILVHVWQQPSIWFCGWNWVGYSSFTSWVREGLNIHILGSYNALKWVLYDAGNYTKIQLYDQPTFNIWSFLSWAVASVSRLSGRRGIFWNYILQCILCLFILCYHY